MLRVLLLLVAFSGLPATAQEFVINAPRTNVSIPPPPPQIYVLVDGQQVGPMDEEKFKDILGNPAAAASTYIWMPGMEKWELASTVAQLQGIIASIGQESTQGGEFTVSDIQSYSLGVWISQRFTWTLGEKPSHAIIQMKLLPDGKFEGASLFWEPEKADPQIQIFHEKGTWTMSAQGNNSYVLERNYGYTSIYADEVLGTGQSSEKFDMSPVGPNVMKTKEGITFSRVPEAN